MRIGVSAGSGPTTNGGRGGKEENEKNERSKGKEKDAGHRRKAMSRTLAWALLRLTWRGHSDFRQRPTSGPGKK